MTKHLSGGKNFLVGRIILALWLLVGLGLVQLGSLATPAKAAEANSWRETSLEGCKFPVWLSKYRNGLLYCTGDKDLRSYDLLNGTFKVLYDKPISIIFEDPASGLLLANSNTEADTPAGVVYGTFRSTDGGTTWQQNTDLLLLSAQPESYGSKIYYGIASGRVTAYLVKSSDAGQTWQNMNFQPRLRTDVTLAVHPSQAGVLYTISDVIVNSNNTTTSATIYRSEDGGNNWKATQTLTANLGGAGGEVNVRLQLPVSKLAGPDFLQVFFRQSGTEGYNRPSLGKFVYFLSTDKGDTFSKVFEDRYIGGLGFDGVTQDYKGALYTVRKIFCSPVPGNCGAVKAPQVSFNGGTTWEPLGLPDADQIYVAPSAINVIYAMTHNPTDDSAPAQLYRSTDQGKTWTRLENVPQKVYPGLLVTDYLPLGLVLLDGNSKAYYYNDSTAEKPQTRPFTAIYANDFYPETMHNLGGVFRGYWQAKGGLAQFGYPKTEVFREVNPSDGKIYPVQYFERNRFEWHAENTGTQYEVLLGLLGNQLTEVRRAAGETPFKPAENANQPGGAYFPETRHNLSNLFRGYWEQNGGLAIYGYPVSESFEEVNPDDGHTYTVQYFERNRFEYHPENKGTKYEVLLGLLGNSLLRLKGWL
jgi:hypothetical protein